MDIIFRGRHTDVLDRFRKHATAKLAKIGKLDQKAMRVNVEVSTERKPRQSGRKERVELTISSRGPVIRAEAAAEDRYAALDMAVSKLESRLRRAGDRRKCRHGAHATARPAADDAPARRAGARSAPLPGDVPMPRDGEPEDVDSASWGASASGPVADDIVPIEMEGDGPLVVREKFHIARPMAIDQALFEMELVGHDFFLFRDLDDGCPSVVYRRQGYQYGVIRLVEEGTGGNAGSSAALGRTNGQARTTAEAAAG